MGYGLDGSSVLLRLGSNWASICACAGKLRVPVVVLLWPIHHRFTTKKLSFKENTLHTFIFLIGIQGLGGGAYLLLAPVYSMETSQISIRGTLGGAMSVMLALGGLLDNGLGAVIHWFPMTCIIGTLPSKPWF